MKALLRKILLYIYRTGLTIDCEMRYSEIRKKYDINPTFRFNGMQIMFYGDGRIVTGANSYIGEHSTINSTSGCKVIIGDNCSIGHNVRIYSSTGIVDQDWNTDGLRAKRSGNVIIEDGVWIGVNVYIGPGISIGKNAVIGANSVITMSVEGNTIVGGVPAKKIRYKDATD